MIISKSHFRNIVVQCIDGQGKTYVPLVAFIHSAVVDVEIEIDIDIDIDIEIDH